MVEGCIFHFLPEESVARRWEQIEARGDECAMCACCLGPSLPGSDLCTRCEVVSPEQWHHLLTVGSGAGFVEQGALL